MGGLPVARLFLNGGPVDGAARATVHDIAREFIGRVAFLARNATSKAHEWRHHGLPSGRFPAFAVARSMAHNATRYAFLDMPKVPCEQQNSSLDEAFWRGPAKGLIASFLEDVLAHRTEPSLPSQCPPEEEVALGAVRRLVGRTCRSIVESSQ